MSSHREAPEIAKDPVADSTDLYAFVSLDDPDTVTFIANYIPLQSPDGGPNFFEFGDDVLYQIHIDNNGDGSPDVTYQFQFRSVNTIPSTFLYNDGPIESLTSKSWNRRQTYDVTRLGNGKSEVLARDVPCPPCNIGPLSTPNYASLAKDAVRAISGGRTVFAGQRAEAFYVDLGSIFDLGGLRPIANLHATFGLPGLSAMPGVNSTAAMNVHSIAIQVPISDIAAGGTKPTTSASVGVWTTASRRKARVLDTGRGASVVTGPYVQVSRLGNPLVNEVLVPLSQKDSWNASAPKNDSQYASGVAHPELAGLLNVLYPGAFPNLAAYTKSRADLEAILLTGISAGVVSSSFSTFTGTTQADMLRLNLAIPPASTPNALDVVTIELRAVAGATIPLVDKSFTPDKAIADVSDGLSGTGITLLSTFPYLGTPYSGYSVTPGKASVA